jgi:hypothetical protein
MQNRVVENVILFIVVYSGILMFASTLLAAQSPSAVYRIIKNFILNYIPGLIGYSFFPKKPSVQYEIIDSNNILYSNFMSNMRKIKFA